MDQMLIAEDICIILVTPLKYQQLSSIIIGSFNSSRHVSHRNCMAEWISDNYSFFWLDLAEGQQEKDH
jgi:hypothetical protein